MPSTYTLIKGETLASSAASYTFTAIPSIYTDIVVRASMRADSAARLEDPPQLSFNTGSISRTSFRSQYSSGVVQSFFSTAASPQGIGFVDAADSTANTFGSVEIYIPNYSSTSLTKPFSSIAMAENNAAQSHGWVQASYLNTTSAISSITIAAAFGNWVIGSSFYLYGIKNS
jgi:hypothetical protein